MIAIDTNLDGVIRRLERFRAGLPAVMLRSMDPKRWRLPAYNAARLALESLETDPVKRRLIPIFIAGIRSQIFGISGFSLLLTPPQNDVRLSGTVQSAVTAMAAIQSHKGKQNQPSEDEEVLFAEVDKAIEDWVRQEKELSLEEQAELATAADPEQFYRDLSRRIRMLLFDPKIDAEAANRAGLAAAIQAWLQEQEPSTAALDTETAGQWLITILNAWRQMVLNQLPQLVKQEIRKLWRETGESLI